jgi:hypothetical protein
LLHWWLCQICTVKEFYRREKISFKNQSSHWFYGPLILSRSVICSQHRPKITFRSVGCRSSRRTDLAKFASPPLCRQGDPPFLIIHGEKDESVPLICIAGNHIFNCRSTERTIVIPAHHIMEHVRYRIYPEKDF